MRGNYVRRYIFFLILLIFLLVNIVVYWHFFGTRELKNDAAQYHEIAINLLQDNSFSLNGSLTMFREPGYPFFLFLIYKVFGVDFNFVRIAQLFLFYFTIILLYFLAKDIFNPLVAKITAVVLAVFPIFSVFINSILSEILAVFLMTAFTATLYLAQKRQRRYLYFISGTILGGFILVKSVFLFLIILIPVLIFYVNYREKVKSTFTKIILFFLSCTLLVVPWMIRNYVNFHQMSIASRGGLLLYIRAVKTTFNTARIFKYSVSSVSGEYVVRRFWDNKFNFEQEGQGFDLYRQFVQDFRKNGNNNPDSLDKALKNEAFKFIKLHPIKYLLYGFIEINNLNSPIIYYDRHFSMFHNNVYNKTIIKLTIVILLRFFWLLFLFLVLFGIYRIFREKKRMAYVFIILILYINLILFFLQGYPRSLVSVLPLYIMLAVYSFNHLMGRYILRRHNYK